MVFSMIHVKNSLLLMGKVWSLDFLGELTKPTVGENQVSGRILSDFDGFWAREKKSNYSSHIQDRSSGFNFLKNVRSFRCSESNG